MICGSLGHASGCCARLARQCAIVIDRAPPIVTSCAPTSSCSGQTPLRLGRRATGRRQSAIWRCHLHYQRRHRRPARQDSSTGKRRRSTDIAVQVMVLTCSKLRSELPHWNRRAPAETVGISLQSVQRMQVARRLQPHRMHSFKHSNDPLSQQRSRTSLTSTSKPWRVPA